MTPAEVFRFVATRAPRVRRQPLDLVALGGSTSFLTELLNDLRSEDPRDRAIATAEALLTSPIVPDDPASDPLLSKLEDFHARYRRSRPTAVQDARDLVADVFDREAEALLDDPDFQEIVRNTRDAILALKLRPQGRPDLLARLVRRLQSADLIRRLATVPHDIDFGGVSSALTLPLRLPNEFRALAPGPPPPPKIPDPVEARVDDFAARLGALDRAVLELSAGARGLVRRRGDPGRGSPTRVVLSDQARMRLSGPTRAVLADADIDLAATSFTEVLDALEARRLALAVEADAATPPQEDSGPTRVTVGTLVLPSPSSAPALPMDPDFLDPSTLPPTAVGPVLPSSVGELLIVRQQITGYEGGELSHAENVMESESRSRSTRRLRRTEETFLTESEETSEEERDLQSTERFEMQSEIQNTLANSREFSVGASVSAGYGPFVQVEAHTEFQTSNSEEQVQSNASQFAQEMTERTASRISQRVRTQRTRATLEEFEEQNSHGFDNTTGDGHVTGLYQWLDRVYEMQVYDYGVRLLFEFTVPEPAAMYLNALEAQVAVFEGVTRPKKLTVAPSDINASNYRRFAGDHKAEGVVPPPPTRVTIGHSFSHASPDGTQVEHTAEATLTVPPGYQAVEARAEISINEPENPSLPGTQGEANRVEVLVGHRLLFRGRKHGEDDTSDLVDSLDHPEGDLPVAVAAAGIRAYAVTIVVECAQTASGYEQWQLSTYEALARAAAAREAEYHEQLATLAAHGGLLPEGRNPTMNRIIERNEIKRLAISMLSGQRFKSTSVPLSPQAAEFDFHRALRTGRYARFWETVVEWDNLSYELLPYYWARQSTWGRLLTDGADPTHTQFVAAGAATVRLAVTPGFEPAILHFLETGEIWSGGELPTVTRDDFIAFLDEIERRRPEPVDPNAVDPLGGRLPTEIPVGEPWQIKLPTTLVRLRADSSLPRWEQDADGVWHAVESEES